jgi:hypothetical protein
MFEFCSYLTLSVCATGGSLRGWRTQYFVEESYIFEGIGKYLQQ